MTTNVILNNKPNRKGLHLILIRVTKNRKHYSTSSEIYVKKSEFDKKAKYGKWIIKHLDRDSLNNALKNKLTTIERLYQTNEEITPQRAIKADSFFKYAYSFIEKYNNEDSMATYKHHKSKLKILKAYGGDLKFADLTTAFLRGYESHLKQTKVKTKKDAPTRTMAPNTIAYHFSKLRTIVIAAKVDKMMNENPFDHFEIKKEKSKKERLTLEELQAIRSLDLESSFFHARNIFLFCVNCSGMRIGDAMRLKWSQITGDRLRYSMNKSKDEIGLKLTSEVQAILENYNRSTTFVFPYLEGCETKTEIYKKVNSSTTVVNNCLKEIAAQAGIDKNVSTHIARHTWTQLAINSMANPRTIQKALGHESFNTTENYINDLNFNDVDDINDVIFGQSQ